MVSQESHRTRSRKVSSDSYPATGGNKKKAKVTGLDDDHFEEIKVEKVSHVLSESIKKARAEKEWSQA